MVVAVSPKPSPELLSGVIKSVTLYVSVAQVRSDDEPAPCTGFGGEIWVLEPLLKNTRSLLFG